MIIEKVVFVCGGVRSGKSQFAEQLAASYNVPVGYIATSEQFDSEMTARIQQHQQDRQQSQVKWHTYECPYDLPVVQESIVIFECVTTWLTNQFFIKGNHNANQYFLSWLETQKDKTFIIVSNDIFYDNESIYADTNRFLKLLGNLHTNIVEICDEVYECQGKIVKRWR